MLGAAPLLSHPLLDFDDCPSDVASEPTTPATASAPSSPAAAVTSAGPRGRAQLPVAPSHLAHARRQQPPADANADAGHDVEDAGGGEDGTGDDDDDGGGGRDADDSAARQAAARMPDPYRNPRSSLAAAAHAAAPAAPVAVNQSGADAAANEDSLMFELD